MNLVWKSSTVFALIAGLLVLALPQAGMAEGEKAKMLIERKGCLNCHSLNGRGGKMGPPLQSTAAWSGPDRMRQYIHDPRSVNPKSIMPVLHLSDEEIDEIVEFLQSFKDTAEAPKGWKPE